MKEKLECFKKIDEDYLVGLTNKGTVKRAAKDLEKSEVTASEEEKGIVLRLEDVECHMVWPVGESTCSCPSRSICKHIIMGAIYLKNQAAEAAPGQEAPVRETAVLGTAAGEAAVSETADTQAKLAADVPTGEAADTAPASLQGEGGGTGGSSTGDFASIREYSLTKLIKQIGNRKYPQVLEQLQNGIYPEIEEGASVITVRFIQEGMTVKLLEPLEYSTCTCHKKDICIHKAEAILTYQFTRGLLSDENLVQSKQETDVTDYEQLHRLAAQFSGLLSESLTIGLARTAPSVPESFDRLAIAAHNAGLADFERRFREIAEEYRGYLKRKVSFQTGRLMDKLATAWQCAEKLQSVSQAEELAVLAGEFKSSYRDMPAMHLAGFGCRSFHSKSGYEGFIVYLLELEKMEWFTFTKARPTIYEDERRHGRQGNAAWGAAPWGLECSLEDLSEREIVLLTPKVNKENRISSSEKSRAEIMSKSGIQKYDLSKYWYEDFSDILNHCLDVPDTGETSRLIFVKADRMESSVFDEKTQIFGLPLFDRENRKLLVSVRFSKEEKAVIRELERIEKKAESAADGRERVAPVFLGIVRLEEGKLSLYPVAVWEEGGAAVGAVS